MASAAVFREWSLIRAALGELVPARLWESRRGVVFSACVFTLVGSLVLGGGTRGGFLSDAVLELFAVPALLAVLWPLTELPWKTIAKKQNLDWVLAFCLAAALLPLIQLVPLPPWIWTRLPGHDGVAAVLDLVARQRPWMPISVSANATWLGFLALLPPMAIFLGVIQLTYEERRRLSLVIIAVGVVSAFVGLIQVAQGPTSPLRFFAFTNDTEAVGFFANRNHFAALVYAVLLFAAAWAIDVAFKVGSLTDVRNLVRARIVPLTALILALIVLIAAEAMARSRAGLVLAMVALAGVFALAAADRRNAFGVTPGKLLVGATTMGVILAVQFALYRILDRFAEDPLADARIPFARNTIRAALSFLPFGSGLGTFVPVYATFEQPSDTLANIYANHAHNDILEFWLETGVIGAALAVLFVIWVGFGSVKAWWKTLAHASELDCSLVRAATIVIALLIAHSVMDYPLRTEAMMAIFAFSCGLLLEPFGDAESAMRVAREASPEKAGRTQVKPQPSNAAVAGASSRPRPASSLGADKSKKPTPQPGERWGQDIVWPKEWRSEEPDPAGVGTRGPEKEDRGPEKEEK